MSTLDLTGDLARRRRRGTSIVAVVVLAVGLGAGAWWYLSRPPAPDDAAAAFASAWDGGDPGDGPVAPTPATVRTDWEEIRAGMGEAPLDVTLTAVTPDPDDGTVAAADLTLTWTLPGERTWTYDTTAPMSLGDDGWTVTWSATVAHPELVDGATLRTRRTTAPRADVLAEDGTALVTARPVVEVGVQPSRVEDVEVTADTLRAVLELDLLGLEDRIEAADPDHFVPVVTLRDPDYEAARDELQPIPGAVFQRSEQILAPTREFARPTLGAAGPVTGEMIEEDPDRFQVGDLVGLSGLQRTYDEQLAGRPGLEVVTVPPEGSEVEPATLFAVDAEPGEPVTVTLDADVQRAADAALADQDEFPSSLVAIRVSDGHVLAVANGPGNDGLDLALTGRYAPGSTFKVVTTAAFLDGGVVAPDDEVACPAQQVADGRAFTNAEGQALGDVTFRTAFADSCNTAFVGLSSQLAPEALRDAATAFGLGHDPALGVDAFTGEVPVTESVTELAAASIGQGRILASPFAMADVAATAARGAALTPSLVLTGDADASPVALSDAVADVLPALMRAVVTDGSGGAVADVPGGPVHGKTGTAEYGTDTPPRTHAWFIGWQDDLAFAVLVAETPDAYGGQVAAPIAADFLTRLRSG